MAKTRRTKTNRSPGRPYRNSRAYVIEKGDMITTKGVRGRTKVIRVVNDEGKRVTSVRSVAVVPQIAAKGKAKTIFVGRKYTGVARSKVYPTHGKKRGGVEVKPAGLLARAAKAVKSVIVHEA